MKRFRNSWPWIVAAATLLLAALLIWQCADIYFSGIAPENLAESGVRIRDIYSREIVAERFSRIAWAFWVWLAVCLIAWIGKCAGNQANPVLPTENRFALAIARAEKTPEMLLEEKKRRVIRLACAGICVLCGAFILKYLLNAANFESRDLEPVMGRMMLNVAPWVAVAFAALLGMTQFCEISLLREIELAKKAPKRSAEARISAKKSIVNAIRIAIAVISIVLIAIGVLNGGMRDVLVKAVNICTECIGLG